MYFNSNNRLLCAWVHVSGVEVYIRGDGSSFCACVCAIFNSYLQFSPSSKSEMRERKVCAVDEKGVGIYGRSLRFF